MKKLLVNAPGVKGVFLITAPAGLTTENLEAASMMITEGKIYEGFKSYTDVDNYRLHTLKPNELRDLRKFIKTTSMTSRKISADKLPVCWRNL